MSHSFTSILSSAGLASSNLRYLRFYSRNKLAEELSRKYNLTSEYFEAGKIIFELMMIVQKDKFLIGAKKKEWVFEVFDAFLNKCLNQCYCSALIIKYETIKKAVLPLIDTIKKAARREEFLFAGESTFEEALSKSGKLFAELIEEGNIAEVIYALMVIYETYQVSVDRAFSDIVMSMLDQRAEEVRDDPDKTIEVVTLKQLVSSVISALSWARKGYLF